MFRFADPASSIPSTSCAALLATALAVSPATAQTAMGRAKAVVLQPMTLMNTRPLAFGSFLSGPSPGTVTIDADSGARTVAGGVTGMGGDVSAAGFTGYTSGSAYVRVNTPEPIVTLTRIGGTETMTITDFTVDGGKNEKFSVDRVFTFQIGGTLAVAANQADGDYEGTFAVTAEYQ